MATNISETLKGLSVDDIRVDVAGRVVITNPKINDRLKDLVGVDVPIVPEALDNVACCTNGYQCGCSGFADLGQRIASRRLR